MQIKSGLQSKFDDHIKYIIIIKLLYILSDKISPLTSLCHRLCMAPRQPGGQTSPRSKVIVLLEFFEILYNSLVSNLFSTFNR